MRKFLSMFLALAMLLSITMLPVSATEAGGNWNGGTLVNYDAEDPDGDGIKDNTEAYTVTVPAQLAPGTVGEVVLAGTWASDRMVIVTADEEVVLKNSINENNTKTLAVTFTTIEQEGSNTSAIEVKEDVSVAGITNAIFGTWSGTFNYMVDIVDSQTAGGCDTLYWDGNTEGLEAQGVMYKISNAIVTLEDCVNGIIFSKDGETINGSYDEIVAMSNALGVGVIAHNNSCFFVPADIEVEGEKLTAGVYFSRSSSGLHITIPGYTGFEHTEYCGHLDDSGNDGDSSTLPAIGKTAEEYTWAEISAISEAGIADEYFNLGDTKTFALSDGTEVVMEMVAFNADDKADGSGKAGISWISKDLVAQHVMNSTKTNEGGWKESELRSWMQGEFYATLPVEVKSSIVNVSKTYYDYSTQSILSCVDSVWAPSLGEMYGHNYETLGCENSGAEYTGFFTSEQSRIKTYDGTTISWWLRTARRNNELFRRVTGAGVPLNSDASTSNGVALGFCT